MYKEPYKYIMEKVRQRISEILGREDASQQPFSDIAKLCNDSALIWSSRWVKDKREKYKQVAEVLISKLTPELLSDGTFYSDVDGIVHAQALRLLSVFVPRD